MNATDTLDTVIRDQSVRSRFAASVAQVGPLFDPAYNTPNELNNKLFRYASEARHGFTYEDHEELTFTLGQIQAWGLELLLAEADDTWSREIDALFDRNLAGDLPNGPAFAAESGKLDRRIRRMRDKATQAACGVTYARYIKALG